MNAQLPPSLPTLDTPLGTTLSYSPNDLGRLAQWIERQRPKRVNRFILQSKADESRGSIMCEFSWEDGDNDANALAVEIQRRAEEDGRYNYGRQHAYNVLAFAENIQKDRFSIVVRGAGDGAGNESREATGGQIAAALMQHAHMSVEMALGHTNEIVAHYRAQVTDLMTRNRELESEMWALARQREDFASKRHDRELERIRAENEDKNFDFVKEQITAVMPLLLAKFASSSSSKSTAAANTAPVPLEEKLVRFLASLKGEQLGAILSALEPEQQLDVNEIFTFYGEREIARQAAEKAAAASTPKNRAA